MVCTLRFIDVRYLEPQRVAFRAQLDTQMVRGDNESAAGSDAVMDKDAKDKEEN